MLRFSYFQHLSVRRVIDKKKAPVYVYKGEALARYGFGDAFDTNLFGKFVPMKTECDLGVRSHLMSFIAVQIRVEDKASLVEFPQ